MVDQLDVGLYPNIPAETYHGWDAASQTILKTMRDRSPAHAYEAMIHPQESTPAQILGTAVHAAVLQPDLFKSQYTKAPDIDRRTKVGRDEWAALIAGYPNVLKADDYNLCIALQNAVWAHPVAKKLLVGQAEQSALWKDPATGLLCKARFDVVSRVGVITDLKTTEDASKQAFSRGIDKWGYHIQAAFYLNGAHELGIDADAFPIIAVEKEAPYCVVVYNLSGDAIKAGQDELAPLMETFAKCKETGIWPGYPNEAVEIDLPRWAYFKLENEINERMGIA